MAWTVEYDNDTGDSDDAFFEWWIVSDGERSFQCYSDDDAKWLLEMLDKHAVFTIQA